MGCVTTIFNCRDRKVAANLPAGLASPKLREGAAGRERKGQLAEYQFFAIFALPLRTLRLSILISCDTASYSHTMVPVAPGFLTGTFNKRVLNTI